MKNCLYKLDAALKLREWCIWGEHFNHHSCVYIRYGKLGSSPTFQKYTFDSSPNSPSFYQLSHPRASGPKEAAEQEIATRTAFQINRKGYTTTIPRSKPYRPMFAKVYKANKSHIPPTVMIQPKLNGIRCLASKDWLKSRTNNSFHCLNHISKALESLPEDTVLDGELYIHKTPLNHLLGATRRDEPNALSTTIEYHVFDIVDETLPYAKRYAYLSELFTSHSLTHPIVLVDTLSIPSTEIDEHYNYYLRNGYEGAMIRNPNGPYEINVRSLNLLKYKPRQSTYFKIWDVKPMSNNKSQGVLELEGTSGHFDCSIAGSQEFRHYVLKYSFKFKGRMAEVEFEDYSEDNKPLQPVCIRIL